MSNRIIFLLLLLNLNMLQIFSTDITDYEKVIIIDKDWVFFKEGNTDRFPASVPGSIHSDLQKNALLENPFYGKNEEIIKWVENENWIYETSFIIDKSDYSKFTNCRLIFDGLDTFSDIYLNGKHILNTDNMFISWEKEVRDIIMPGKNTLTVKFTSPIKAVENIYNQTGINYPADNDRNERHLSVYARKAPYHYGWDWGIRMVGCGIWRPVKLVFYNNCRIDNAYTRTESLDSNTAKIVTELTVCNESKNIIENAEVYISIFKDGYKITESIHKQDLVKGTNILTIPSDIHNPELWQPNGWGEQHLYDIIISLKHNGKKISGKSYKTGIRTIEFINETDDLGRSFYFSVNGNPIFAKGANYIPQDIILTNVTKNDYIDLFRNMKEANMNMVRVWGGGIYENELFYELADKYGILVWQDFMFACSTYPGNSTFLDNIGKEAEYNIKRLRNHPSLALWCGNNEIYEGLKYWGWNKRYDEITFGKMKMDYDTIFKKILNNNVKKFDPQRSYIHTSPDSANWGRPATQTYGDIHYWGIWYGREMFDSMDTLNLRFVSEFGFESFPEMKTIRTFADETDMSIDSEVMTHRQKSSIGNELIKTYMQNYYYVPDNFDDFVYVGLLLQGHGVSYGIETNRRQRPVCMGSLYWQLNDSWPAISWSAIDYYKNKKALYYHSKKAFAPLILSAYINEDSIAIYTISDLLEPVCNSKITVDIEDFFGKKLNSYNITCNIEPNSSNKIASLSIRDLLGKRKQNEVVMRFTISKNGETLFKGHRYFTKPKNLSLPHPDLKKEISKTDNEISITLTTDVLAKDIFIEIPLLGADLSDNFFDLMAGESKKVTIKGKNIRNINIEDIRIRTLTDTYKQN